MMVIMDFTLKSILLYSLLGALVVAAVFAIGVIADRQRDRHRAEMAAWASAHGMQYLAYSDQLAKQWTGQPFVESKSAQAVDILSGSTPGGHPFWSYVYKYIVGTDDNYYTVQKWILVLQMPRILPWLTVVFETFGAKLAQAFGGEDIKVESDDFNKAYRVQSGSPQFALAVLNPSVIDWLLGHGRTLVPFRIVGQNMIWWGEGEPDYEQMPGQISALEALIKHIPSFVWDDYGKAGRDQPHLIEATAGKETR